MPLASGDSSRCHHWPFAPLGGCPLFLRNSVYARAGPRSCGMRDRIELRSNRALEDARRRAWRRRSRMSVGRVATNSRDGAPE